MRTLEARTPAVLAALVLMLILSAPRVSSGQALNFASLNFTSAPTVSQEGGSGPTARQMIVSVGFQSDVNTTLGVYVWVGIWDRAGQAPTAFGSSQYVGVFMGSATIAGGRNATIQVALLNLAPGNYSAQVFATGATGTVLSNTVVVNFANPPGLPFSYPFFLAQDDGSACAEETNGTWYGQPCWTSTLANAYVFDCLSEAASPAGCTQEVLSTLVPTESYNITLWYPYVAQPSEPSWANCMFSVKGNTGTPYAYCVALTQTAFVVTSPGFPPVPV